MIDIEATIDQLMPDFHNPRIGNASSRLEALTRIVELQGDKIANLAKHIVENGLSPIERMFVVEDDEFPDHYIVIEGNRRATALILLSNPALITSMDVFRANADLKRVGKRLVDLAKGFDKSRVEPLKPVLASDRDSTRLWVEIRHGGQRDGVGITRWTTIEAQRFANPGARLIAAADFLHEHGGLSEVERELLEDISWTTFDRFLDSPRLRGMLGLGWENRTLLARAPKEEIAKGLRSVAFAVAKGEFTSRKHNTVDDRVDALKALPEGSLPDPAIKIAPVKLSELTGSEVATPRSNPTPKKRAKPDPKTRDKLFKKASLDVTDTRILGLYYELCGLSVKRTPNACAVLLRVFLEMSVVHYLAANGIGMQRGGGHQAELHVLIERAFNNLKKSDQSLDLSEIEKIVEARTVKGRMRQLHDWVHARNIFPSHSDLVAMADELTPFLAAIWKEESDA